MNREFLLEHKRSIKILNMLKNSPPRVLIIEGGLCDDRVEIGKYWSALVNCPCDQSPPCLECELCRGIVEQRSPDFYILDGRHESIKIDQVRVIQRDRDIPPREANYRIFLFNEAQNLSVQAANSLLKVLEEPEDKNLFVLLVPQKTLLLPTIISRGFLLTLKWKIREFEEENIKKIIKGLLNFWVSGKGLFNILKGKKTDKNLVKEVIFSLQRSILNTISKDTLNDATEFFKKNITSSNFWNVSYVLNQAYLMLETNLSPEDILYWLAFNLYTIFNLN